MSHAAINQILERAERAKSDSDFTYFFTLLLAAEAMAKTIILGLTGCVTDEKDRHRYRIEYDLVRADGMGDWGRALDDILTGHAAQYLLADARSLQIALSSGQKQGSWQHDAVSELKLALTCVGLGGEEVPVKTDIKRWFRLFAILRNGTRAHGATPIEKAQKAALHLASSLRLVYSNYEIFKCPWAYIHRNLSGRYSVSAVTTSEGAWNSVRSESERLYLDGVYLYVGAPRLVPMLKSNSELTQFFYPNGAFSSKRFELISYTTDDKADGDSSAYLTPPGALPSSETEGSSALVLRGNCFTNSPEGKGDYVARDRLETELYSLLADDNHPIITLLGKGGIGKTSLALRVLQQIYAIERFSAVLWFSARDVDLEQSGPKSVRPAVLSIDDMSRHFSTLVLSNEARTRKDFNAREYFEQQLRKCEMGPTLFVFDNFETMRDPLETFVWIETHIRSPNKALVTTRLRDFRGDFPVEVRGMEDAEAYKLIQQTIIQLHLSDLVSGPYKSDLVKESEGHPYVIKILLGEVAKAKRTENIRKLISTSVDILTALFERTYAALSPCAQRAFLTLSSWNSAVPRIALEAVLQRSTGERGEVERGVESLLQFSMAESTVAKADSQEFVSLPMVSTAFGRKKLNVSPHKAAVDADVEVLQMLGATRVGDVHLALASRLERFFQNCARARDPDGIAKHADILEMICRSYPPGWLIFARWYFEAGTPKDLDMAREKLRRYLESDPSSEQAAYAWSMLARVCHRLDDLYGEAYALIERAQIASVPFTDVSAAANRLNSLLRSRVPGRDNEDRRHLVRRLASIMDSRQSEADADDFSRMAWLSIHLGESERAKQYIARGLQLDSQNQHCLALAGKRLSKGAASSSKR
jgi:tetratricopeptide (TPR) repeat protein